MDWLRIAAFALLIFYHVGMVFVPWNFHINADPPVEWITVPMLALSPWRLTLLFVVSGYASRKLLSKSSGATGFLQNRSYRLLVPLIFGMVVIVPPQPWVELVVKHGYARSFDAFWLGDYFRFGKLDGIDLPTWNHLWFVAYLWVYTVAIALTLPLLRRLPVQAWFDRAFGHAGVLWLPLVWLIAVHSWWFAMAGETHAFFGDWVAHVIYFPALLFGFGLAGSERAMAAITRAWKPALMLALIGYAIVITVELTWPGKTPTPRWVYRPYGLAHALQQWGAIIALIALAERKWNRDAAVRPMLTEAVFPFYLVHQTIIVVVAYWLLPANLPKSISFAMLAVATIAGCWAFYLGGRAITPLRPLIGLRTQR